MEKGIAYRPGRPLSDGLPLARFLPPLLDGPASRWARDRFPAGAWLLDPFGSSPSLPFELARAGYRVLVAANNPIIRFLLEAFSNPPDTPALQAALAHVANARIGSERLEPHLLSIYETTCDQCGERVSADEFLWERGAPGPFARIYHCPHCLHEGEYPASEFDTVQAQRNAATSLHVARALARVAAPGDPERPYAEEALSYYPPRAVYALFALINKLDTLPTEEKQLLSALLLVVFDRTNTLWPFPVHRPRPRQLTVPPKYRERNVFRELENAVRTWEALDSDGSPLSLFPDLPAETGGVCMYEGRIRSLSSLLEGLEPQAVVTALPRPNQAFWTLSALWSGWLWGSGAVDPFKSVLRRQRYDWRWHTTALHAAFQHLHVGLSQDLPVLALMTETEAGFLSAAITAAQTAGWGPTGIAYRSDRGQTQLQWQAGFQAPAPEKLNYESIVRICRQHLQNRGEPAGFTSMLAALLARLDLEGALQENQRPSDLQAELLDYSEKALTYRAGFLRYNAGKELDIGTWWLREEQEVETPLSDRLEAALRDQLKANPGVHFAKLDEVLCTLFPGLLTPEEDLVMACLQSYGEQDTNGGWSLRPEDDPLSRKAEYNEIRSLLVRMGGRLGFQVEIGSPMVWSDLLGTYNFYITTTAGVGEVVFGGRTLPGHSFIVVPGSRANLILHKRRRDPRLDHALQDWRFLKFRALRHLADNPMATRVNLDEQLRLDDFQYETLQIRML